nr:hypothetical protein BaRGS_008572 [Batillaria attramentaria]
MNACRKKPAAPLHPIPVPKKKWSLVGMDIIGPLQVTDRGNQYIVALTDHFTKFPVAKAIPCKSSEEVARFMYETICIFGAFDSLITDQGREFINFALDILTDRFNINHRISSAYHPETNGQRERDNRTLKDTLVKITDNDDWDELLPAALFAYRTSVHKSTQFSPFLALYGEQAKLPFDVTGDANEQDLNEEIMDTMKGIHEEVKNKIGENISRAQKKQKEYYDSRRAYDHGFRIGDKVLIINAARVHRMGGKMAPRFVGPYEQNNNNNNNNNNNTKKSLYSTSRTAHESSETSNSAIRHSTRITTCSFLPKTPFPIWSCGEAAVSKTAKLPRQQIIFSNSNSNSSITILLPSIIVYKKSSSNGSMSTRNNLQDLTQILDTSTQQVTVGLPRAEVERTKLRDLNLQARTVHLLGPGMAPDGEDSVRVLALADAARLLHFYHGMMPCPGTECEMRRAAAKEGIQRGRRPSGQNTDSGGSMYGVPMDNERVLLECYSAPNSMAPSSVRSAPSVRLLSPDRADLHVFEEDVFEGLTNNKPASTAKEEEKVPQTVTNRSSSYPGASTASSPPDLTETFEKDIATSDVPEIRSAADSSPAPHQNDAGHVSD